MKRTHTFRNFIDHTAQITSRSRAILIKLRQPRAQKAILWLVVALLAISVFLAIRNLPQDLGLKHPAYLLGVGLLGVPIMIIANVLETRASARYLGMNFSWYKCLHISVIASAANILPLPGGAMVRVATLHAAGVKLASAGGITTAIAFMWLGLSLTYAAPWMIIESLYWLGIPVLLLGGSFLVFSVFWITRLSGNATAAAELLCIKFIGIFGTLVRLACALLALNVSFSFAGLSVCLRLPSQARRSLLYQQD